MLKESPSSKPFPWKCARCGERAIQSATVDYAITIEHDGRSIDVAVPELAMARCEACGEVVLDDEANEHISDAIRARLGLLTPAQIRQNRARLGLTSRQLASALGIGEANLARLESGGQIQPRALDRLLRLYFGVEQVRTLLSDETQLASLATS